MIKEIEKKYSVNNLGEVEERLLSLGAKMKGESSERDIYFNVSGRDSMASKECLRIRSTPYKSEVTYKPPTKIGDASTHFAKKETNLLIQDIDGAKELLECIGSTLLVDFTKHRKYYLLDGATITLDSINDTYSFVEIEIESNDEALALAGIQRIENLLRLSDENIEKRPYRDIAMGID